MLLDSLFYYCNNRHSIYREVLGIPTQAMRLLDKYNHSFHSPIKDGMAACVWQLDVPPCRRTVLSGWSVSNIITCNLKVSKSKFAVFLNSRLVISCCGFNFTVITTYPFVPAMHLPFSVLMRDTFVLRVHTGHVILFFVRAILRPCAYSQIALTVIKAVVVDVVCDKTIWGIGDLPVYSNGNLIPA